MIPKSKSAKKAREFVRINKTLVKKRTKRRKYCSTLDFSIKMVYNTYNSKILERSIIMKLNKTLSLILAIIMVAATFGAIATPAAAEDNGAASSATTNVDISWYEANPEATTFTISTADQLDGLAYLVNNGVCNFAGKTVKLGADIVYNTGKFTVAKDGSPLYNGEAVSETNQPRVWPVIGKKDVGTSGNQPIELNEKAMFYGDFNGCGHSISGLYVYNTPAEGVRRVGLFSVFAGKELRETSILNSYFYANGNIGSFAGDINNDQTNNVTLEYLYSNAYVVTRTTGKDARAGGIVGNIFSILKLNVNKCAFEGNMIYVGESEGRHTGGLIGATNSQHRVESAEVISNCLVNAKFSYVGNPEATLRYWGGLNGDMGGNKSVASKFENNIVIITVDIPAETNVVAFGFFLGVYWYGGMLEMNNNYGMATTETDKVSSKIYSYEATYMVKGEEVITEYSKRTFTDPIGVTITNPTEATGLDTSIFLLTAEKAAIKDLNACFDGHAFTELYQAKPASCDGDGWSAHYRCNNCSKYFDTLTNEVAKETVIIPETHEYGTLIAGTPATCTENGTLSHYKCSLCNRMFNEDKEEVTELTILAGHTYGDLVPLVKPTCEAAGAIAHYKCSACNKMFDADFVEVTDLVIPVIDHKYGRWNEPVAPTPNAAGVLGHYKCDECRKYFDADKNELASIEGEPKLTTTKKPDTTKAPTTTAAEEKGCGGFAAVGSLLALIALTGAAVVIKKK